MDVEQFEALIGGRCGKVSALLSELQEEMIGLAKEILEFVAEHPVTGPFIEDLRLPAVANLAEATAVLGQAAARIAHVAETARDAGGPGLSE